MVPLSHHLPPWAAGSSSCVSFYCSNQKQKVPYQQVHMHHREAILHSFTARRNLGLLNYKRSLYSEEEGLHPVLQGMCINEATTTTKELCQCSRQSGQLGLCRN